MQCGFLLKMKTIESKVAETILQKEIEIKVGGATYMMQKPTIATLILVSEEVSKLNMTIETSENAMGAVLLNAKNGKAIAKIAAILILGAKRAKDGEYKWWQFWRKQGQELEDLTMTMLEHSPSELYSIVQKCISNGELVDFFALTTFLTTTNLLKTKGEVETTATQSGGK